MTHVFKNCFKYISQDMYIALLWSEYVFINIIKFVFELHHMTFYNLN